MCPATFIESRKMLWEWWKARSTLTNAVDLDLNSGLFIGWKQFGEISTLCKKLLGAHNMDNFCAQAGAQANGFGFPKVQAGPKAVSGQRSGPAFFGLAWPGFWPQAGAGTSLEWTQKSFNFLGKGVIEVIGMVDTALRTSHWVGWGSTGPSSSTSSPLLILMFSCVLRAHREVLEL